ncbi:MAG: fumarylacetoacetate hydrolase family protein [Gammaproteobacteria bacterium]|nr:fumarylacetoacetate hydrolase family protein [Gammaproteobacteria bacterium]MBU1647018.1 fumarylacetoacetate hydrolase family protein [Gammaproteobacteria bacterium]MBU1972530.1 fumarylacetoacetate hydrolase family protein [Gammaproteobacteria bacterium]
MLPAFSFARPLLPIAGSNDGFPVRRIFCVGRNYAEHAREMGASGREPPFFFCKPADAVVPVPAGTVGQMDYPPRTADLQHEVELVIALGRGGRDIAVAAAASHVFGQAIGFDMTRRDLQKAAKEKGQPWEIGKAFDQSAPVGPIHRIEQIPLLTRGEIGLDVNGEARQRGDVADMIWPVAEIIAELSGLFELAAGDLIFTGTPAGVGPVRRGDHMSGRVAGLGELDVVIV